MKTYRYALAFACGTVFLAPIVASGFSIEAVMLSPTNIVEPMVELRMVIDIMTPSIPTSLYAPTQVSSNASGIRVDVFPTSGMFQAIGSLRETVVLGTFAPGTYNYQVEIHPAFFVGWGTRTNLGSFSVLPRLRMSHTHQDVVLRWTSSASNFTLQATTTLSASNSWTTATNPAVRVGDEFIVTNRLTHPAQFYRLRQP